MKLFIILTLFTLSFISQADQGITSDVHQSNIGKIVFANSNADIAFKKENPSAFKNSFKASENIFARLYLEHSIGETPHQGHTSNDSTLMWDLSIDGKKIDYKKSFGQFRHIPENDLTYYTESIDDAEKLNQWTSWRVYFMPAEDDPQLKYGNVNIAARAFVLALLEHGTGKHQVEIKLSARERVNGYKTDVIAQGQFDIEVSNKDIQNLAFKYAPKLPKDRWVGVNKAELLADLKIAFTKELKKQPLLVGLYSSDWNQGVYKLTGQKYRKFAAWAIFNDTDKDGQVPITTFNWVSDNVDGKWSKPRFDSHCNGCPDWDVEVASVKAISAY